MKLDLPVLVSLVLPKHGVFDENAILDLYCAGDYVSDCT